MPEDHLGGSAGKGRPLVPPLPKESRPALFFYETVRHEFTMTPPLT